MWAKQLSEAIGHTVRVRGTVGGMVGGGGGGGGTVGGTVGGGGEKHT